jgi:hypothetical protein
MAEPAANTLPTFSTSLCLNNEEVRTSSGEDYLGNETKGITDSLAGRHKTGKERETDLHGSQVCI